MFALKWVGSVTLLAGLLSLSAAPPSDEGCAEVGGRLALDRQSMCYILHGFDAEREAPKVGYRLLVVLPGGDGSAEFRAFVGSIQSKSLPREYLVAQAVAPVWEENRDRIVWPTRGLPSEKMKFPTEEFIAAIIDDVQKRHRIDAGHIYALGWSSGGPPLYASILQKETELRGAFIAMSVFHPNQYPPVENAKGRSFYLLHSPQDFIPMRFPEQARDTLAAAGANVHLRTYDGGHGWHGDVYGMIRAGVEWLEAQAVSRPSRGEGED